MSVVRSDTTGKMPAVLLQAVPCRKWRLLSAERAQGGWLCSSGQHEGIGMPHATGQVHGCEV